MHVSGSRCLHATHRRPHASSVAVRRAIRALHNLHLLEADRFVKVDPWVYLYACNYMYLHVAANSGDGLCAPGSYGHHAHRQSQPWHAAGGRAQQHRTMLRCAALCSTQRRSPAAPHPALRRPSLPRGPLLAPVAWRSPPRRRPSWRLAVGHPSPSTPPLSILLPPWPTRSGPRCAIVLPPAGEAQAVTTMRGASAEAAGAARKLP